MNGKRLEGKVAIVTGSSRGIGKAIALALAREGAAVTVAARTAEETPPLKGSIMKTAEEIKALGGRALPIKTDIGDEEQVATMVAKTLQELGRIDILVNNAGGTVPRPFKDLKLRHWDAVMRVNLRGLVAATMAVLPTMIQQKYGHIINISSAAATVINDPFTGMAYDVSKAGVNRLTWGLAEELKQYNIAVNALAPRNTTSEGWVYLNPNANKSRWQTPEQWGRIAAFVASQEPATFIGRLFTAEDAEQEMAKARWILQ